MPSDAERLRRWLADAARNIELAEEFLPALLAVIAEELARLG